MEAAGPDGFGRAQADRRKLRTAKADTYAALGVHELWLVDLERRAIEQRVLEAGRWRVAGVHAGSAAFEAAVFPGLTVVPEDAFAPA